MKKINKLPFILHLFQQIGSIAYTKNIITAIILLCQFNFKGLNEGFYSNALKSYCHIKQFNTSFLLFMFIVYFCADQRDPPVLSNNIKCVGGSYRHAVIAYTDNTARNPYILIMGDKRLNLNSENQYKPMT